MEKFKAWFGREWLETKTLLHEMPAVTMALFVLSVVGMNLLANKSIDTGLSWLALDAGMLLSWLSFLTMDITVKRFGPKASIKLSLIAALINLLLALVLFVASVIPGQWGESFVESGGDIINAALNRTFAGTWYVVLGSTIAFIASSVTNNLTNWGLGKAFKGGGFGAFAARSYISTLIGQFVDNMIFALIVSHNFFGWTLLQCVTCSVTGMLFELLCEIVFSPIGYRIAKSWEKDNVGNGYLGILKQHSAQVDEEPAAPIEEAPKGETELFDGEAPLTESDDTLPKKVQTCEVIMGESPKGGDDEQEDIPV